METGVSVIVPAYNEQGAIAAVLERLVQVMAASGLAHEIIVVDDGSRDATAQAASSVAGVTVLRHERNRGYGASLKTAIRQAAHEWVCITDADGTYPNERIPELCRLAWQGQDMVVGARVGPGVAIPLVRRPAKWFIGRLAGYVANQHIPDINSGLRVFRRDSARQLFGLLPDGFSFTTTITLAMLTNGYAVQFVPIEYHPRIGRSKIRPIQDTLNFVQLILRIGLYFSPLRVFVPLSLGLFILAVLLGLFTKFALGKLANVSVLVVASTAIQVFMIGLLAELINHRLPSDFKKD